MENDRRSFLNGTWKALGAVLAAELVWGSWDMLKPSSAGAFGGILKAGDPQDFPEGSVRYFPEGRLYVTSYQGELSALYQKCPHLGCKVPFCMTSSQFECPCHGSAYNIKGEYLDGPAARGMDRFPVRIEKDQVLIDTGTLLEGPPQGFRTGPDAATGPSCDGNYPPLPSASPHQHGAASPSPGNESSDGHAHDDPDGGAAPHDAHASPSPSPSASAPMDMSGADMSGHDMSGMDMGGSG